MLAATDAQLGGDAAGNVYITGGFMKTTDLNFDDGIQEFHTAPGTKWSNTYLIKLDTKGNTKWHRSWGGVNNTQGHGVVVDNAGDIVVGGWTNPIEMDLDPGDDKLMVGIPAGEPGATNDNTRQMWLSKFNGLTGDLTWGHSFGSTSRDELYGLAVDAANNVYATGSAGKNNRPATGGNWQTNPSLPVLEKTPIKHRDIVTAKFDANDGTTKWVSIYGGQGDADTGLGIAVAGDAVYSVGRFDFAATFSDGAGTF